MTKVISNDLIHAVAVLLVCLMATVYASLTRDHSANIWIVYGSAIAFAAGRAGVGAAHALKQPMGGRDAGA